MSNQPKIVCGIDPSLTGFAACVGTSLTDFRIERWISKPEGVSVDARMRRYEYLISDFRGWLALAPDVVMLEGYSYGSTGSVITLAEFGGVLRFCLTGFCDPQEVYEVSPHSLKKYTTGSGGGDKTAMISAISSQYGHQWPKNDHYDAFALYVMALHHAGQLDKTTAHQRDELAKVRNANAMRPAKQKVKVK